MAKGRAYRFAPPRVIGLAESGAVCAVGLIFPPGLADAFGKSLSTSPKGVTEERLLVHISPSPSRRKKAFRPDPCRICGSPSWWDGGRLNRSTASGGRKMYRQTFSNWSRRRAGTATSAWRTESTGGQVLYQFRRAWSDGSTALLLDPLELLERLAALVPPPRRPLLASHGLLAPRARWRSAIVPTPAWRCTARPRTHDPRADGPGPGCSTACSRSRSSSASAVGGPRRILGAVAEPHAGRRLLARGAGSRRTAASPDALARWLNGALPSGCRGGGARGGAGGAGEGARNVLLAAYVPRYHLAAEAEVRGREPENGLRSLRARRGGRRSPHRSFGRFEAGAGLGP
jgi:hypothetical protein